MPIRWTHIVFHTNPLVNVIIKQLITPQISRKPFSGTPKMTHNPVCGAQQPIFSRKLVCGAPNVVRKTICGTSKVDTQEVVQTILSKVDTHKVVQAILQISRSRTNHKSSSRPHPLALATKRPIPNTPTPHITAAQTGLLENILCGPMWIVPQTGLGGPGESSLGGRSDMVT